jgi:hypothetical protein
VAYYKVTSDDSQQLPDKFLDVFSDFDFTDIDISCDFFCPECRKLSSCETYSEIKNEWDFLYM